MRNGGGKWVVIYAGIALLGQIFTGVDTMAWRGK
jgi:hypothetical protein